MEGKKDLCKIIFFLAEKELLNVTVWQFWTDVNKAKMYLLFWYTSLSKDNGGLSFHLELQQYPDAQIRVNKEMNVSKRFEGIKEYFFFILINLRSIEYEIH